MESRQPIQSYEDLDVFQRSMALVRPVHDAAKKPPKHEEFDLAQQMRRASKSVPTNIAEGFSKRRTAKDFKPYLGHALGSANEMLIHLKIAQELEYFTDGELKSLKRRLYGRLPADQQAYAGLELRVIQHPISNLQSLMGGIPQ